MIGCSSFPYKMTGFDVSATGGQQFWNNGPGPSQPYFTESITVSGHFSDPRYLRENK